MQKSEDNRVIIESADVESSNNKSAIRVLHVDDDPCILEISKQILMEFGNFEIDFVCSVDEGFKKLSSEHYDVVISDFEMPQKNGLDFLKELREQNNRIPFILFTGKGREDVAITALNLGADRYINKQGNPETVYGELSDAIIKTIEHKQSRKMLAESESKYRRLVENSLEGIAIIQGPPPKFVFANEAMGKLFGYTPEELIDLSSEQIIRNVHPDDRKAFFNRFKKRMKGKEPESNYVFRGFRKDGTLRWVEVCANLIEFNGKPAVQGLFLDITEAKKAEEALLAAGEKFRTIFENVHDVITYVDTHGKILDVNERIEDLLGYKKEEIIGKNFFKLGLFKFGDVPKLLNLFFESIRNGSETKIVVLELKHKNGNTVFVEVGSRFIRDKKGRIVGVVNILRDVTENKKAESDVLEQKAKAERYLNIVGSITLALDVQGKITLLNKKGYEILGYQEGELFGKDWFETCLPKDTSIELRKIFNDWVQRKTKFPEHHENAVITKVGEKRAVSWHNTELRNENGEMIGTLSSGEDVTERRKAEEALVISEEKFRQAFEICPDAFLISTLSDAIILDINETFLKMFGYTRLEVLGNSALKLGLWANPSDRETVALQLRSKGKVSNLEIFCKRKNGETFPVLLSVSLMPANNQKLVLSSIRDLSSYKQTEAALRESEEKFRNLAEESPNMIFINNKGRVVYANKKCEEITGYSREEFYSPNFNFLSLNPPEYAEDVKSAYLKHMRNEIVAPYEYVLITKDGKRINAIINTSLIEYNGDKAILGIITDITEHKKTEEILRQERDMLESVAEASGAGLAIIGKDYHVLWANDFIKRYKGDTIGKLCYATLNSLLAPCSDCGVTKIFEGKTTLDSHEYCSTTVDGNPYWVEIVATPLNDENGNVTSALEICVDITERKKNESALMESEKRSRAIVANSPIGIATSGANKLFLSANQAFCKILGYTEIELRKLTFVDITHPEDLKASIVKMDELENGKMSCFSLEKRYIKKDGTVIDGNIMVSVVRNLKGEPSLYIAELEDITERKKAEEHRKVLERKLNSYSEHLKWMVDLRTAQLKDANERLVKSERLAAIGELAGMVGHDLRNPLTGIKNAAYFLKKKGTTISETQAKEMLEIIDKAIDHSNKIINDLLDYSREMHLELTKYEARALLDETLRMIQVPDRIQILNHIQEETWIWVNSDKMMRVFLNLIKNAIDAMPDKGILEIRSHQAKDNVEIAFADTGSGITEETMRKLFTPLFTTKAQGMGFGLAICKRIVEAHGGAIMVRTALNKGTTFTISLPTIPKVPLSENQSILENQNAN